MKFLETVWSRTRSPLVYGFPFFLFGVVVGLSSVYVYRGQAPAPLATATVLPSKAPTPTPDAHPAFTFDNLLIRLNEARLVAGLQQLATDNYLSKYAQQDLVGNCPVTSHSNFRALDDRGVFRRYKEVAEALRSGGAYETPAEALDSLLISPTHKDLLLTSRFTSVGIGVVTSPVNCVSFILGE